jgi:hypothetical protein
MGEHAAIGPHNQEKTVVTTNTKRTLVAANIPAGDSALSARAHAIIGAITGNALVPNPNPSIATLTNLVVTFDNAQTATKTRAPGTVAARNVARGALRTALHTEAATIQQLADANPEHAQAIIESVSMNVRQSPARIKVPFSAKPGKVSGSVDLAVKAAAPRASYEWEWSGDGGHTWTPVAPTLQAKTTITGLPVGTTCQFRYRPITKTGPGDWSQVIALVVK